MQQKKRRRGITEVIRDVLGGSPMLPNLAAARTSKPKGPPPLSRAAPSYGNGAAESVASMRAHEKRRKPGSESLGSFLRRRRSR